MSFCTRNISSWVYLLVVLMTAGCNAVEKPPEQDVVKTPEQLKERVPDHLKKLLDYAEENEGRINDSVKLRSFPLVRAVYEDNNFQTIWSNEGDWHLIADSLFDFLSRVKEYGLFPSDYYLSTLTDIKKQISLDSLSRKDAALWTRADLLLTASYFNLAKDLKIGRLERDSTTLRNDSLLTDDYFIAHFRQALVSRQVIQSLHDLEPKYAAYERIKACIKAFLETDTIPYEANDSLLQRFRRIALTLDKYKQLGDTMPLTYVWVNIPSYTLSLYDADTITLQSKVIVGAPRTRTPLLTSDITNFITYPQWTVPYSIVFKEMLPKIKQDLHYLNKQNLMVVDRNDSVVDPVTINWSKMSKSYFPYLLRQRQGDDNSLGVIKFNFRNKYSVYLHDTNARWLFNKTNRALSHGCVRVQQWEALSHFLVRDDTIRYPADTLKAWINRQEKHTVSGFPKIPVFIRYFTVEGKEDGTLKFYNDIYKEDSILSARYFTEKR